MQEKGFINYIVIIAVVLVIVFLSQRPDLLGKGKTFTFFSNAAKKAEAYLASGSDWVASRVFPDIQKRGEMVKQGVDEQKEKISESVGEKIKNYFSGIGESILHPGTPQNCEPQENSFSQ